MLFDTIDFAVYLPIVFALYWLVNDRDLKLQNSLILVASYIFYGWWDWRFLFLILCSTLLDYAIGRFIYQTSDKRKRKLLLWTSICVNVGFLGFFKYYNFFVENFTAAFSFWGININSNSLNIVLPVGISFYTFQTMSYTIDIYRNKLKPTKDFIAFAAFISFFPQLVAGPIERATRLLPQFYRKRKFNYACAVDGVRQILWGLFKKIVIANNFAVYVNDIFTNYEEYSGSTLVLGAVFFAFQIYCDFSGYSDIAIGTARLFGINLMKNFAFPYFSRDIAEFWRRWHISLSTWFRDYLYIPLGGSRGSLPKVIRNIFIIFLVSGFWHGANWTFVIWGGLNAIYYLPLLVFRKNRKNLDTVAQGRKWPTWKEFFQMASTFGLTVLAWVFFRADNLNQAVGYLTIIFSKSLFSIPYFYRGTTVLPTLVLTLFFIVVEWMGREQEYALEKFGFGWPRPLRYSFYLGVAFGILFFAGQKTEFIYFQF